MAYLNYLASISAREVRDLIADPHLTLESHAIECVSHLVAYWVHLPPLGGLLGEAIDGGQVVSAALWHPLRRPVYHPPARAAALYQELAREWREVASTKAPEASWYAIEIEKVLRIYRDATENGLCVLSALEPPADEERAARVHVPINVSET